MADQDLRKLCKSPVVGADFERRDLEQFLNMIRVDKTEEDKNIFYSKPEE